MLRSKIHRATVTQSNPNYLGSLTIDEDLLNQADLASFEQIHVLSVTSGERLVTYAIPGKKGSGIICTNGAAALKIKKGETIIILAFCDVPEHEVMNVQPRILLVDKKNKVIKTLDGQEHVLNIHKEL